MKKKLAMAAALLPNPDLLFLDEPFEGVDAVTSRVIRDLLAGFVARGSTVFLTSHVLEIVERLCTHVGIIVKGVLVEQASLETIRGCGLAGRLLPGEGGGRSRRDPQAELARGGGLVNWEHFKAFVWLRWKLLYNKARRAGVLNAVITTIAVIGALLTAIPLFIGCFILGINVIPKAQPAHLMFAWDAIVVAFLFFWLIGLITELQRSDPLSLSKFLHLPVSANGAFLINYFSSLLRLSLIIFLPVMLAFGLALVVVKGVSMVLVLPLLAAFVLMVTAVTYQFQGWLAALMSNPRRRRTVIMIATVTFVLIVQLPNLVNFLAPWGPGRQADRARAVTREFEKLNRDVQTGKIGPNELARRHQEIVDKQTLGVQQADREEWNSSSGRLAS